MDLARELGLSDKRIKVEAMKFRFFWTETRRTADGKRICKRARAWSQSWVNWCSKAIDIDAGKGVRGTTTQRSARRPAPVRPDARTLFKD